MKIAIIEDDMDQARLLAYWLKPYGFESSLYVSGEFFLQSHNDTSCFNLILVDWMLPGIDGLNLVKLLCQQQNHPPIIFVTDKNKVDELASALHSGADDFISKPLNKTLLLARIMATLRRFGHTNGSIHSASPLPWIDKKQSLLRFHQESCHLTHDEILIMSLFLSSPETSIPRHELLEQLGLHHDINSRALDLKISRLRKKLSTLTGFTGQIHTMYGQGYLFRNSPS